MTRDETKKRIEALKKEINKIRYAYHVEDKQIVPDSVKDSLQHELYTLEQKYPEFITPDSPTQRVGGEPLKGFKKITHSSPMLSMEDVFSTEELNSWEERLKRLNAAKAIEVDGYFTEIKMDGLAIALIYKNGLLATGATRGNGIVGEDVVSNLKTIEAIPLKLELDHVSSDLRKIVEKEFEVRGEVFMPKKSFDELNKAQEKQAGMIFANPRNAAAGSIRQLNPKMTASRKLDFLIYEVITYLGLKTHKENLDIAQKLGFKINKFNILAKNLAEIERFHETIFKKRENLPYWTDGIVVKLNNLAIRKRLGFVGKAWRWEIAYKFAAQQATTVIEDIIVQVGRTGALTPIAVMKPVLIGGTTVSRASLHNEDEIKRKDIRIDDTVIVQKAGDIIPEVTEVLKDMRPKKTKEFRMPTKCPICGHKVLKGEGEAIHYCSNPHCFAQNRRKIIYFVSRAAFDIDGLGPKIIDQLLNNKLIKGPEDLFKLKVGDLEPLERFAEKSAANLFEAIQNSKKIDLARFIYALGIRHVGAEMAEDLAKQFGSLENLIQIKYEDVARMYGVGEKVARSVYDYFSEPKNKKLIEDLLGAGVEISRYRSPVRADKLKGRSFVVTGVLETMSREEAHKKIIQYGGDVQPAVSSKINYLIVGENPGSKLEKAKKLGVKIISEKEFMELIH